MRGIGYTLINFINHLPADAKKANDFVFYTYDTGKHGNPLELLDLNGVKYESRVIKKLRHYKASDRLPRSMKFAVSFFNQLRVLRDIYLGDSRIKGLSDIDHFIQFDQMQPLPSRRNVKSTMIIYDLIPYVMEPDYLWGYRTARVNGCSIKGAARYEYRRRRWAAKARLIARRAKNLIAISEHTKQDFVKHLHINPKNIHVCLLGVDDEVFENEEDVVFEQYTPTGWGPMPRKVDLRNEKFILFVGGADHRRHLVDLVAAFNNLRARGENIKLVLAGDTMMGPFEIPNLKLQDYFENTSYLQDIIFLGFVDDIQRDWLYKHALAFVYPSVYEGFGLPILEAMQHACPVICYKNTSIPEVAGNAAMFANSYKGILKWVRRLMEDQQLVGQMVRRGRNQADKYSWSVTSSSIIKLIDHGSVS
jgi:glycosyltransferase involved in cell wall biosynthesis